MRIAIVADSSSGITQAEAKELGVYIAPVPVLIDEDTFYEDLTITQADRKSTRLNSSHIH